MAWMIKCKNKYYCNPYEHYNPEDIPVYLAGNDCIRFKYDEEKSVANDVIPRSDTIQNVYAEQINVSLDESKANMIVEKTVEAKGISKDDIIDDVLALTPFMESDYRNMDGASMWEGMSDKATSDAIISCGIFFFSSNPENTSAHAASIHIGVAPLHKRS